MDLDREELTRTFLAEAEERLAEMESSVVALEARPSDGELIDAIFRAAHTLKGSAGVLELEPPAAVAHVVEAVLDRIRDGRLLVTSALVTLLLRSVDALRLLIPAAVGGAREIPQEHRALIRALEAVVDGRAAAEAPLALSHTGREETGGRARTLRVDVSKLDRMLDLTGEVAVARGRLLRQLEQLGPAAAAAMEAAREADRLCLSLQEMVLQARMVPVGPTFSRYARMVRDVAAAHDKCARLVIEGDDVELDTAVLERLVDPLTHMIRNALDHGVESPDVRSAAGKDPCATVTLRARHDAVGSPGTELEFAL